MPLVAEKPDVVKDTNTPEVLPLENGDTLSSKEFLRRYEAMPEVKKAELIDGIVYIGSPVSVFHGDHDGFLHGLLAVYAFRTAGVRFSPNITVFLDPENTLQPDATLRILPEFGGRARLEDHLMVGPPELVVEIAASSVSIDLHHKFRMCQRNGVQEYLVWLLAEREIRWFVLEEDRHIQQIADSRGYLSSRVFPGLTLSTKDLFAMDGAAALAVLEEELKRPAHAAFVESLHAAAAKSTKSKPA